SLPTQQRTTAPLWEACGIRDLLWIALENTLRTVESELRLHGIRCEQNKGRDRSRPSILIRVYARNPCLVSYSVEKGPKLPRARRMSQLAESLRLDLPDSFASNRERLADFFERVLASVFQSKPHLYHFLFARSQSTQYLRSLLFQVHVDHRFCR